MTSQSATSRKPTDEDGDETHRLRDIVVEEVSLVDRAANKRRFLVVKRSEDMPDEEEPETETMDDDDGATATVERVQKAKKKPKAEAEPDETEKARRRPAAPADDEDADTEKARRGPEDEEEEAEEGEAKKKAASRKAPSDDDEEDEEDGDEPTKKARRRRGAAADDEPDDEESAEADTKKAASAPSIPKPLKDAILKALTEALERLMEVAKQVKEASEPGEDDEDVGLPEELEEELEAIAELLENATEIDKAKRGTKKKSIAKAGARMAKDRLDRFQKALALLSDVLKELTNSKEAEPRGPTAGAAEAGVEKRAPDAAPGMRELVAGIGELTRVVKHQEEELGRLRKARGVSNAIPVEGGGRRPEPQAVSWPLDMNRPISRDSVAKAVSFYEE
jgi:hypothetical protein